MTDRHEDHPGIEDLLGGFTALLDEDRLAGNAEAFLADTQRVVNEIYTSGVVPMPPDPFKGRIPEAPTDPDLYLTMFWRMFDRMPAAMVQPLAIPLRRLLAQRIFRHCGEGVIFHHNVLFSKGSNISVGDHSLINRYVMLDDRAELTIGAFVMVAAGVTIETHTHPFDDFSLPIAYGGRSGLPVVVGDNSVLGYNTVLMAGTTVGYRCIIGANSVVTKDIADYTVAGGVPAKPIKQYLPPESGDVWSPSDGKPFGT
jgi:acetyltransferase-like isoleucine patch superfamily enzyme